PIWRGWSPSSPAEARQSLRRLRGRRFHARGPPDHPVPWVVEPGEAETLVETLGVSRAEELGAQAVDGRVCRGRLNEEHTETLAALAPLDEDVAQPGKGGLVGHPAAESHLRAAGVVAAEHDRVLARFRHQ